MEFGEKLQELRKEKGLTQEELAKSLYVSRTAISKWESGRGYPNIDSLKEIANFFGVTIDDLLSSKQLLVVAEEDKKQTKKHLHDLVYGILDLSVALLFLLPFFAVKSENSQAIQAVSLLDLYGVQLYVKIVYFVAVSVMILVGVATLALQKCNAPIWVKSKTAASLILGAVLVILFMITMQPYAAVFSFVLLAMKGLMLIKR